MALVMEKEVIPSPPDPVIIELNRLENNLREKERELGVAHCEIKALKVTELLKDKAVVENLEIKKLMNEKKEALAAQFAAEATLRRVHANQNNEEFVPLEAIIAPYESDIRKYKIEIASLQEDIKALERLIKSKDVALVEVERTLHSANERAMIVENLQNQNLELKRQKEICQEENRLLEKANRQKVLEVESLSQTIRELEESILAGGVVANAVRDYQRQVAELNGEIQRLRDKLTISERTAKAETQLRDKFKLRLKILEEGLKGASNSEPVNGSTFCNGSINKRSSSQTRASVASISSSVFQQPDPVSVVESTRKIVRTNSLNKKFSAREILAKKNLWAPRSKFFDGRGKENSEEKVNSNGHVHVISPEKEEVSKEVKTSGYDDIVPQINYVSLYYLCISLLFW